MSSSQGYAGYPAQGGYPHPQGGYGYAPHVADQGYPQGGYNQGGYNGGYSNGNQGGYNNNGGYSNGNQGGYNNNNQGGGPQQRPFYNGQQQPSYAPSYAPSHFQVYEGQREAERVSSTLRQARGEAEMAKGALSKVGSQSFRVSMLEGFVYMMLQLKGLYRIEK